MQRLRACSNCYRNISEATINFEFTEGFQLCVLSEAWGLSSEDEREYRMITLPWLSQGPCGKSCVLCCGLTPSCSRAPHSRMLQGNACV